jgi:hypothetical protein
MPKWEYGIGSYKREGKDWICSVLGRKFFKMQDLFDFMGENGWELVGVSTFIDSDKPSFSTVSFTYTTGEFFYFKRPKP